MTLDEITRGLRIVTTLFGVRPLWRGSEAQCPACRAMLGPRAVVAIERERAFRLRLRFCQCCEAGCVGQYPAAAPGERGGSKLAKKYMHRCDLHRAELKARQFQSKSVQSVTPSEPSKTVVVRRRRIA